MRAPPDHIDGHQHVHVLPGIRGAVLTEVARRYPVHAPLLRDPSDRLNSILSRASAAKALTVAALAIGFSSAAHKRGLYTNDSFAGFSRFDEQEPFTESAAPKRAASRRATRAMWTRAGEPRSRVNRRAGVRAL
jgi:predicted glycoside hydrolase/deacetylase ChbG (UPF0249 family)